MRGKPILAMVSASMVLSLVVASCATTSTEPAISKASTTPNALTAPAPTVLPTKMAAKPKYGGTLTCIESDPMGFDPMYTASITCYTMYLTHERLLGGDWTKGPAGTGETDWTIGEGGRISLETGILAESWELPDPQTTIYHIRKGVHFWNKAPANGREMTGDDVAWTFNRLFKDPKSVAYVANVQGQVPTTIEELDRWTVKVTCPPEVRGQRLFLWGDDNFIECPEVVQAYGDMKNWRNTCGTGPFMLTDYVQGASVTFGRNPNYWRRDPANPDSQLPYIDGVKWLVIVDPSTQLAAFRTGKIDQISAVSRSDRQNFLNRNSQLRYIDTLGPYQFACGRVDKPDLPFKDIRVRQALNLAVDKQAIVNGYYQGDAWLLTYPIPPLPTFKSQYMPLDEMPSKPTIQGSECSPQELFTYNPDKAKKLLAEAGYPNGFKTNIVCTQTAVDYISIIREYLLKVGVDMQIAPLETGVYTSVMRGRTFDQMILGGGSNRTPYQFNQTTITNSDDPSFYTDDESIKCQQAVSLALAKDDAEVNRLLRAWSPHIVEAAWGIWTPTEKTSTVWWPWLQNFYGCINLGRDGGHSNFARYCWIDQALKESLGY